MDGHNETCYLPVTAVEAEGGELSPDTWHNAAWYTIRLHGSTWHTQFPCSTARRCQLSNHILPMRLCNN